MNQAIKTSLTVGTEKKFHKLPLGSINVSVVKGYNDKDHTHEYQLFDLKNPIKNIALIGVENNDEFAIKFQSNFLGRYGLAIYLDGINVSQKNGIKTLNEIPEEKRQLYSSHKIFIVTNNKKAYLERFNQINGTNRKFTFTLSENKSINYNLIDDKSLLNKIEIYFWREIIIDETSTVEFHKVKLNEEDERSYIGAGRETNKSFGRTNSLINPEFLGKVMFVHIPKKNIQHLGENIISIKDVNNFTFEDPMDLVPKS